MSQDCVMGVDVSSEFLDIHVLPQGQASRHTNDTEGIKEVLQLAKDFNVTLIVMESTGGLEMSLPLDSRSLSNDGHVKSIRGRVCEAYPSSSSDKVT